MSHRRNRVIALLLSFLLLWPSVASAAVWANFTITVNGKPLTYKMPLRYSPDTKSYTTRVTLKLVKEDGQWVLKEDAPGVKPPVEVKPNPPKVERPEPPKVEKPLPPKEEKPLPPKEEKPPVPQEPKEEPKEEVKEEPSQALTPDEAKMLELVNQERAKAGLPALKVDMKLTELARKKSQDMVDNNYFSHTSPTYGSPFDMMKAAGVSYRYAGENLAGAAQVESAHRNLMNSPGHRANILNSNFDHIGIGIIEGSPYGKIYTQMFIGK